MEIIVSALMEIIKMISYENKEQVFLPTKDNDISLRRSLIKVRDYAKH